MRASEPGSSCLAAGVVAAWVQASCARQGVPIKVTDPGVVARVAVLLGSAGGAGARKRSARTYPPGGPSQSPDGHDPGRIQGSGAADPCGDDGVVQDCGDGGGLLVQVEGGPLSA